MENNKGKKIFFIPGWMHSLKYYNQENGLDIWLKGEEFDKNPVGKNLVGHSLGANFALTKYSDDIEKIVVVNPVILENNVWKIIWDWFKFALTEKTNPDGRVPKYKMFSSLGKVNRLAKLDYKKIFSEIPKEKITVLRGEHDEYLCGEKTSCFLKELGVNVIEVEGAGHRWSEKFDQELEKIFSN